MYELYASRESASDIIRGVLDEIGAAYTVHGISLSAGDQHRPEFLAINPAGRIPVLVDDGKVIFETAAIILHLLDKHPQAGLAPVVGSSQRATFYQWLVYVSNTLQTAYSRLYFPERFTRRQDQTRGIRSQVDSDLAGYWRIIDTVLSAPGPFMLGAQFSALDIYVLVLASWHRPEGMIAEEFSHVQRCIDLVADRPAIKGLV